MRQTLIVPTVLSAACALTVLGFVAMGLRSTDPGGPMVTSRGASVGADEGAGPLLAGGAAQGPRSVEASLPSPGTGFYSMPVGRQFQFELDLEFATSMSEPGAPTAVHTGIELAGRLQATAVHADKETLALELVATEAEVRLSLPEGEVPGKVTDSIAAEFSVPAYVLLSTDGLLEGFRFDGAVSGETRNLWRSLVGYLIAEVRTDAEEWTASVPEPGGEGTVQFRWTEALEPQGFGELTRRRLAFEPAATQARGGAACTVHDSSGTVRLGEVHRMVERVQASDELRLELPGGMGVTQRTTVDIRQISCTQSRAILAPLFDFNDPWLPALGTAEAVSHEPQDRDRSDFLADLSPEELISLIESLIAAGEVGSRELFEAQNELAMRLATDPLLFELLGTRLELATEDARMVLLAAAGMAQTSDAQLFLAKELTEPEAPAARRVHATWSAFQVESPEPTLILGLQDTYLDPSTPPELREASMLALGVMTSRLGAGGDGGSLRILLDDRERAERDGDLVAWLEALGNSGSPEIIPEVRPYLEHDQTRIRQAAASSLRLVMTDEAATLLSTAALGDVALNVRAVAAGILAERQGSIADEAIDQVLFNDVAAAVRRRAIEGLGRREVMTTVTRTLLLRTASDDVDADTRAMAESILLAG